jgi:hypothetical protein
MTTTRPTACGHPDFRGGYCEDLDCWNNYIDGEAFRDREAREELDIIRGEEVMFFKVTGLTVSNHNAVNEVMPEVQQTATTATFTETTAALLVERMAGLPSTGHPRQSLHAVVRKLRKAGALPSVVS